MAAPDEFVYRRVHRASPQLLFECLTSPEHLTCFWGPAGTRTPLDRIVVDLRPGGAFETVMVNESDGSEHRMRAVYEIVDPHTRLAWREVESGMLTDITFHDLADGTTEVVTTQRQVPAHYAQPQARAGWATSLDKYAAYVTSLAEPDRAGPGR
jgi:uncharacterized protein YndB with AHSA1/START domain